MSKKHFITLADYIRTWNNGWQGDKAGKFTPEQIATLADFCQSQNSQFNRELWFGYIAGTCGKNGGAK
jgi:hypothetical protein